MALTVAVEGLSLNQFIDSFYIRKPLHPEVNGACGIRLSVPDSCKICLVQEHEQFVLRCVRQLSTSFLTHLGDGQTEDIIHPVLVFAREGCIFRRTNIFCAFVPLTENAKRLQFLYKTWSSKPMTTMQLDHYKIVNDFFQILCVYKQTP